MPVASGGALFCTDRKVPKRAAQGALPNSHPLVYPPAASPEVQLKLKVFVFFLISKLSNIFQIRFASWLPFLHGQPLDFLNYQIKRKTKSNSNEVNSIWKGGAAE